MSGVVVIKKPMEWVSNSKLVDFNSTAPRSGYAGGDLIFLVKGGGPHNNFLSASVRICNYFFTSIG
jgi:hypothetical protein